MSTVLFLTGQSMGDALNSSGRSIRGEFEALGYDYVAIDLTDPGWTALLDQTFKTTQLELAYSYMGVCTDLSATTSDGQSTNLWQALGTPFVSLYGDTPAYFFDRHVLPGAGFAMLYAFPEHLELRKRLALVQGLVGTLPAVAVDPIPKNSLDFPAKSRGKLVFLKNGNNPEELLSQWRQYLSNVQFLMLMDLASELAMHLHTDLTNDIDALVCRYFHSRGLQIEALLNLRVFFVAQLDDYCRRLKSTLIAESLLDFPIEVHGFNWDHVDFSRRRATLVPRADYSASRILVKESLGVIDMAPNTGIIPHDRCRRAFGSFTLCVTNEQECFRQQFPRYGDFSYQFTKESLQNRIAEILAHPGRFVELGVEVAETYRAGQQENMTAERMLEAANAIRLERHSRFPGLQNYFGWPITKR